VGTVLEAGAAAGENLRGKAGVGGCRVDRLQLRADRRWLLCLTDTSDLGDDRTRGAVLDEQRPSDDRDGTGGKRDRVRRCRRTADHGSVLQLDGERMLRAGRHQRPLFFLDLPASDIAIATACLREVALGPRFEPECNVPWLNSLITVRTLALPFFLAAIS